MSPLAALEAIISNSPATEPRDGPTVGFQRPANPEHDDHANEVVEEAFREGVTRGWWEAAQRAVPALDVPDALPADVAHIRELIAAEAKACTECRVSGTDMDKLDAWIKAQGELSAALRKAAPALLDAYAEQVSA